MGHIIIADLKISFQQILSGQWPVVAPYFEDSLKFCQEWLNGIKMFELKTSGSTGMPRTVSLQRSQMISSAKATGAFFHMNPEENILCCLNTELIAGKMMLVRGMEWDSRLYLVVPSSNPFMELPPDLNLHFAAMVPLQLDISLKYKASTKMLNQVKNLIIGGAPISSQLREKISDLPAKIFQTFGMTETVSHIALANLKDPGELVYQTLPGVAIRQTPDDRLEITAPMTNNTWISTNDIVRSISENRFIWKGRADFIINSGGVKIQPEEVESLIYGVFDGLFPGKRCIIGSRPDSLLGQKMVLIIEQKGYNPFQAEKLLSLLRETLPKYQVPKEIHFLDTFIETASGKVNRVETSRKLFG